MRRDTGVVLWWIRKDAAVLGLSLEVYSVDMLKFRNSWGKGGSLFFSWVYSISVCFSPTKSSFLSQSKPWEIIKWSTGMPSSGRRWLLPVLCAFIFHDLSEWEHLYLPRRPPSLEQKACSPHPQPEKRSRPRSLQLSSCFLMIWCPWRMMCLRPRRREASLASGLPLTDSRLGL